jgi:hypothetical protein
MNLNREQFLKAVERGQALLKELKKDYPELGLKSVFSRFGPRSGQCDLTTDLKKIVMEFPEMLEEESLLAKPQRPQRENIGRLRTLLKAIKQADKDGDKETGSRLWKEVEVAEKELLVPDLPLYCGDVLIEYRPENLNYESLRRLQQDSRLPPGLNTVGSIRVIAGSLEFWAEDKTNN